MAIPMEVTVNIISLIALSF